ncbi:hypothetical protein DFQ27_004850 [Actinomortierella ambigua]|uniref:Uncharacterized protein n=1 Tax=Actinomortierella ambigua TaxID=1343610 RepID=A0A9P6QKT7_9FUNG|nr:hypothetical protein DFQ27_004850 [Actinomortierella ambigua]
MTLSMVHQQSAQPFVEAIARVRIFLGITQELAPLCPSRQPDPNNAAVSLVTVVGSIKSSVVDVSTTTTTAAVLSENEQDKERAWIVSSLLQETSVTNEKADYRQKPVRVALESVLRWIRSSRASMGFSTIISLVDVITAWIASSSTGGEMAVSEETWDILDSMLVTLATLLVAAYTKVNTDDEEEELGSLVASVLGQMAAYASDTSIPEPVRLLAIGVASTLLGECFVRFKFTEAPFLLQETMASPGSTCPAQLIAYEKFLRLVVSSDVWDFLRNLSLAPGATVDYLGTKGSSPAAVVAVHAFLSHEMASVLRDFPHRPPFTPSTTEDSCRQLEQQIVREAVTIHGSRSRSHMMAMFVLYDERLSSLRGPGADHSASGLSFRRGVASRIRMQYQLDQLDHAALDNSLSYIIHQTANPLPPPPKDKTRYPTPSLLADHGWYGTTVLRQILINTVSHSSSTYGARKLLRDSPYSSIYIITGLLLVDTDGSSSSTCLTSSFIEQRLHLGDTSCLDTMLNVYLSFSQQAKDGDKVLESLRWTVCKALKQLVTTADLLRPTSSSIVRIFGSVQKSTWVRLGVDCHNAGFGRYSKTASSLRGVEGPLKLLDWIYRQKMRLEDQKVRRVGGSGEDMPLLWTLFELLIFPKMMAEALDYGLQTQVEASTKAIQSLFQTMIASKFYVLDQRAQATSTKSPTIPTKTTSSSLSTAAGPRSSSGTQQPPHPSSDTLEEGEDTEMADLSRTDPPKGAARSSQDEFSFAALTETMTAMYWAWSDFVDEGHGRSVPKLTALFQAEWTADVKVRSKKAAAEARGVKRTALMAGGSDVATALTTTTITSTIIAANTTTNAGAGSAAATAAAAATAGTGAGSKGNKATSKSEAVYFKKTKTTNTNPSDASSLNSATGHDHASSALSGKGAMSGSKQSSLLAQPPLPPLQLVSSGDLVAQIMAGRAGGVGAGAGVGGIGGTGVVGSTGSSLSNMQNVQQAKVSNPLWAPVLGLSHVPQMQARHQTHVQLEVQRWMGLLAHMDGPTFSEHLTGLIKAVYPSDQKFLLDQVLVELMALEDSAQNETIEGIKMSLKDSRYYFVPDGPSEGGGFGGGRSGNSTGSGVRRFGTEWIVETVIGALVSMVIKSEEQPGYMEPGSLKWAEPMREQPLDWKQVLDAQTVLEARFSSFSSSSSSCWLSPSVSTRASLPSAPSSPPISVPFYSVYDLRQLAQEEGFVLSPTASTEDTLSTIAKGPNAHGLSSTSPMMPPAASRSKAGGSVVAMTTTTKKRRMRNLYNRRVSPFYATLIMFQRKRTTSGYGAGMTFLGPAPEDGFGPPRGSVDAGAADSSSPLSAALTAGGLMDETNGARDGGDSNANNNDDDDTDDESDEAMLRRAQQAERRTLACQAPIRTLLVILQTLTKMNQGGALDAWIVDALSGTIDIVQDRYFEWAVEMLRLRVVPSMATTAMTELSLQQQQQHQRPVAVATVGNAFGRFMTLGQGQAELLRLLPVLTAATGIGVGPLQRAYQRSVAYHQRKAAAEQQSKRAKSGRWQEVMATAGSSLATSDGDGFADAATTAAATTVHWRQLMALIPADVSK